MSVSHGWELGTAVEGRYRVQRIRKGGMGVVYLCYDIVSLEPIAVKTVASGARWSLANAERFKREALLWIQLEKHPHIVQAHYVRQIDNEISIFMEMVPTDEWERTSLADWLHTSNVSLADILQLAIHICRGMNYAYNKLGLVHRDLKPSNVLVAPGMVAKVTDFGLAKGLADAEVAYQPSPTRDLLEVSLHTLTITGGVYGTPPYMAPEQWHDAGSVDTRADVYSVGCILYEMLTGRHINGVPYGHGRITMGEWYRFHHYGEVSDLKALRPDVPEKLCQLAMRCVARERQQRFPSFEALGKAVGEIHKEVVGTELPLLSSEGVTIADLVNRASSLRQLGCHQEAVEQCDNILQQAPDHDRAWCEKGMALARLGRNEEALGCFDRCLEADSGNWQAWCGKGDVLTTLRKPGDAKRCYSEAEGAQRADRAAQTVSYLRFLEQRQSLESSDIASWAVNSVVVICDESSGHGEITKGYLLPLGIQGENIKISPHPAGAIGLVRQFRPDLLITEIALPTWRERFDAYAMIRRVTSEYPDTSILVFTLHDQLEDIELGLEVEANDYLVKPSTPEELRWRVVGLLEQRRQAAASPSAIAPGPVSLSELLKEDMVVVLVLGKEDAYPLVAWLQSLGIPGRGVSVSDPQREPLERSLGADVRLACVTVRAPEDVKTIETIQAIKALRMGPAGINILAMGPRDEGSAALTAGADAYIVKPVTREKFIDTVLSLFPPSGPSSEAGEGREAEAEEA